MSLPTADYVIKAELQDMFQSFAENIAMLLQIVLDAQISKCQNMISMVTAGHGCYETTAGH